MSTQLCHRFLAIALTAGLLGLPPAGARAGGPLIQAGDAAPPAAAEQLLILAVRGGGNWRLECEIETAGGRNYPMRQLGSGVYSAGSIVAEDVVTARCRYQTPENHMLRIALVDEAAEFRCPWRATDDCVLDAEGESGGEFTVSLK